MEELNRTKHREQVAKYVQTREHTIKMCGNPTIPRIVIENNFRVLDVVEMELIQHRDQLRLAESKHPIYEMVYDLIMQCGRVDK